MADFYNTLQNTTGAQLNAATQPLNSQSSGGKGGMGNPTSLEGKIAAQNVDKLKQQAADAMNQQPVVVNTTPAIPGAIFGNAVTEPAIVATMDNKINNLQNNIATNQSDLAEAQAAYNKLAKQKVAQYINNYQNYYDYGWNGKPQQTVNPAYTTWQNNLQNQQTQINNLKNQLTKNKNALQKAITRQSDLNAAGRDAVNWGLAAKAAEENGLQNAMQAYQQAMANAGVRNAIMNAAIGTVGNNGGGGK